MFVESEISLDRQVLFTSRNRARAIKIRFDPCDLGNKALFEIIPFHYRSSPAESTAPINISISRLRDGLSELIESRERI